jgi:hypothetical protein
MQNSAMNSAVDTDSVRIKAYELWVTGGKREGEAVQNWLEAERILRSTEAVVSTRSNAPQATSAPKLETQRGSQPAGQNVPPSSPPLALSEISSGNKSSAKTGGKGGAGRKR